MASQTDICNMALSDLGVSIKLTSISNNTVAGNACRLVYDNIRQTVLKDFPWPFATQFKTLSLVTDLWEADSNAEWRYSYRYPADCLFIHRIPNGYTRIEVEQNRIKYRIVSDDSGMLIYTDLIDATVEYTADISETAKFPVDFVRAFSHRLAAEIAPTVTVGDQLGMGAKAYQMYLLSISDAQANSVNEEQPDPQPESSFIVSRYL